MTGAAPALAVPDAEAVDDLAAVLASWQDDAGPFQLHPGDLRWHGRHGAAATAAALRTWTLGGRCVALGLLDGPTTLRLTLAPDVRHDAVLAHAVVEDLSAPDRGVLPAGAVAVEAPRGTAVRDVLADAGWAAGEAWTPLRHDLSGPLDTGGTHVTVVGPDDVPAFTAVHRSAWGSGRFTDAVWRTTTAGLPDGAVRCLLGRDADGTPVAGVTVWSAGPGRPGLVEPMGVHAAHRGRGHGRAVCVAAVRELARLGASSALVCTPTRLSGAVATYRSAGYVPLPEQRDLVREG